MVDEYTNNFVDLTVVTGGGGGGGVTDHADLTGRSKSGQHPISAITNLQTTLDGKISATDVATTSSVGVVKVDGTTITATADGTISASTSGGLTNTAIGTDSLTILGTPAPSNATNAVNIGSGSETKGYGVSIGGFATKANNPYSIAIGYGSEVNNAMNEYGGVSVGASTKTGGIAIGTNITSDSSTGAFDVLIGRNITNHYNGGISILGGNLTGDNQISIGTQANAIQIGGNTLTTNVFQVWNYPILNKTTGYINADRLQLKTIDNQAVSGTGDINTHIVIQASSNQTVNGYQVPVLTDTQITQAYNGVVAGKNVVITDSNGLMHFVVNQADMVSDEPIISIEYFDIMELTYLVDGTIEYRIHNNQITLTEAEYEALTTYADHTDYRIIEG